MKPIHVSRGVLILFLGLTSFSCSGETQSQPPIRPVRYEQVRFHSGDDARTLSGLSRAGSEARLSFRIGGIVEAVDVQVGQRVRNGELIAVVDDSDASLNYEKALDALRKAETQKDNAKSNLDRVKELYENNNVALSEYESAKDDYASANSAHSTEEINADLKKRELGYYKLYAPMDGIIAEVPIESNEQVSPGEIVVTIISGDEIEVSVGMPEAFISRVKTGDKVSIEFPSLPGRKFDGTVSEVSFGAGAESSTYPVTVTIEHPTTDIRPGMPADVRFVFASADAEQAPKLIVPSSAVGQDTDGHYVFTAVETEGGNAVVHKKRVSVGRLSNEGFEVIDGLQNGELVVTAGVGSLSDGITVKLLR